MSEYRPYPKSNTRQIADYNNVISQIGQNGFYCLDRGVVPIIRQLLGSRGMWRTSYAVSYDDYGYYIPDLAEFEPISNAISDVLRELEMPCDLEPIVTALNNIAQAGGGCCTSGSGGQSPETAPLDYVDDGVNPPDGFDTYAEFDAHHCNAAQWFINSWQSDLRWLQTLDVAALTATGLAAGLIIPGVNVLALVGILVLLVALGVFVTDLDEIDDWITTNNDDLLCLIYSATSSGDAVEAVLTSIYASGLSSQQKAIASYWVTAAAMNEAFSLSNLPDTGADCSECSTAWTIVQGSGTVRTDGVPFTVTSNYVAPYETVVVALLPQYSGCGLWQIKVTSCNKSVNDGFGVYRCTDNVRIVNSPTPVFNTWWPTAWYVGQNEQQLGQFEMTFVIEAV